jgi:hypothetical protein
MNARERRQIERRFKQKVTFKYRSYVDLDPDDLDDEVQVWCNKNVGRRNWFRDGGGWTSRGYYFADPKHATAFILRWS